MDNRLGIKTYQDMVEEIDTKILRNPKQLSKMIDYLNQQIKEIDEELRLAKLEAKYGHTLKKTIEFDFFRNLIQYTETAPDGTIVLQHSRGFKPRDQFTINRRNKNNGTEEFI